MAIQFTESRRASLKLSANTKGAGLRVSSVSLARFQLTGGVSTTRLLTAGTGLTGGGDLSADRTFNVGSGIGIVANADDVALDINSLTADASPDSAADYVATYDASAATHKKVLLNKISPTAAALTKTDDTNVTLTLGGSPTVALLAASSITVGWTGTLALSRLAQGTDGQLIVGQTSASPLYKSITGDWSLSAAGVATLLNIPTTTPMAGSLLATNITAPGTPAAGKTSIYVDSTDKRLHDKNDAGTIGTTVVANAGAASNFLTAISAAGVVSRAQPAFSDLTGSIASAQVVGYMLSQTGIGALESGSIVFGFGSITGLTNFALRDTTAAFDVRLVATSTPNISAARTLTLDMGNVAHTVKFGTTANTITFPNVGSDTVAMLGAANVFTALNVFGATTNFGAGTGNVQLALNAQASGAGNGAAFLLQAAGVNKNIFGNWSFVNGGAYNEDLLIYSGADAIRILQGTGTCTFMPSLAIPAAGSSSGVIKFSSTASFGIYFGSGAPTVSAAKGSLYLRSDGTTTNDRAYINTNGSTTWTALTTAA